MTTQEASDAALAAQLQAQFDSEARRASAAAAAADTAATATGAASTAALACPACTFVNAPVDQRGHPRRRCVQCGTALRSQGGTAPHDGDSDAEGGDDSATGGDGDEDTATGAAAATRVCGVCHTTNRIPDVQADAMLCGACHHKLLLLRQPARPGNGDAMCAAGSTHEATTTAARTVQVRCGSCNAINAVRCERGAREVQFVCGACETTNEVAIE